jgi:hypothetical protein
VESSPGAIALVSSSLRAGGCSATRVIRLAVKLDCIFLISDLRLLLYLDDSQHPFSTTGTLLPCSRQLSAAASFGSSSRAVRCVAHTRYRSVVRPGPGTCFHIAETHSYFRSPYSSSSVSTGSPANSFSARAAAPNIGPRAATTGANPIKPMACGMSSYMASIPPRRK